MALLRESAAQEQIRRLGSASESHAFATDGDIFDPIIGAPTDPELSKDLAQCRVETDNHDAVQPRVCRAPTIRCRGEVSRQRNVDRLACQRCNDAEPVSCTLDDLYPGQGFVDESSEVGRA